MPLIFTPNGHLDVSTDPSDLPQESTGPSSAISGAMKRCKNLRIDEMGKAKMRNGTTKISSTALDTVIHEIVEQSGDRYEFASSKIYRNESEIETGLTDADWSAIKYNSFNDTTESIFALNGTDRKRISGDTVYEWGIVAPSAAPAVQSVNYSYTDEFEGDEVLSSYQFTFNNLTTSINYTYSWENEALEGNQAYDDTSPSNDTWIFETIEDETRRFKVAYTYVRKVDDTVVSESNGSPATVISSDNVNAWRVFWVNASDPQVTHVRIYRTLNNGSTFLFDTEAEAPAGISGSVVIRTPDAGLGSAMPDNHDRAPLGNFIFGPDYDGICFILKQNRVYFSLAKRPEYWPVENFIESAGPDSKNMAGVVWNGIVYFANKTDIFILQGTTASFFLPQGVAAETGTQSSNCFAAVVGQGIFHLGIDGIYRFNGEVDQKITELRFEPIFRGETRFGIPGMNTSSRSTAWMNEFGGKLYFGYASGTNTIPDSVLVYDFDTDRTTYFEYPQKFGTVTLDVENSRLIAGGSDGHIYQIEDESAIKDNGTDIDWDIESKDFTLQTRKHFPRSVKYDVDASLATTATGTLMLDDVVHQEHVLSQNRNTKKRLVDTGNGDRASMRIIGTGPVTIYMMEME